MKLIQQRLLRGANRYAPVPCLMAVVDLEPAQESSDAPPLGADAVAQRLCTLLPNLADQPLFARARAHDGGALLAAAWLEIHAAVGEPRGLVLSQHVARKPDQRRVALAYRIEHVAQGALALAIALLDALLRDQPFPFEEALATLRERAARYRLPPQAQAVYDQAIAAGIPVTRISEHASLLQFGWGSRQWRYLDGVGGEGLLGSAIAHDRQLVRALLDEASIPVPRGAMVDNVDDACRVARRLGLPAWVRPLDTLADAGPPVARQTEDEVAQGFADACRFGARAMIERVLERPTVSVEIRASRAANDAAPKYALLAERAAAKIGLADAVVEIAPGSGQAGSRTVVAGIRPCRDLPALDAAQRGDGRIPIIAVTGTNGKTTTTLMIAHAAQVAGRRTGSTTTQGVFHNDMALAKGDCTGYWSHRTVLSSPETDIAVPETARGGLLKRGLAFDRCTVGVMLNVSDDHLGLEGIDTIEDLAWVKGLVVRAASGAAVLNADDPHCVAMQAHLNPGTETLYFSMDADNPVLRAHLARGGRAVYLRGDTLVLAATEAEEALIGAAEIPCTLGGRARFNIANSLAAAAALVGAGFTRDEIARGLATFVSDPQHNPLRMNMFDVRGIRLIVDYAHNPAAYEALGEVARSLTPRRLVGIVTSPGDRRDTDLQRIGRTCAQHFDSLVVYESSSRGRPYGEAATLIREGAESAHAQARLIEQHDDECDAIRRGLELYEPGDVLAFACGSNLERVVEAMTAVDPEAAARLAAQIN
ncbi:MAG: Mur ligase family protein [Gammaproteobacteria bacterium]